MLETMLEYRKGVLFVRLDGILSKDTIRELNEKIIKIINDDKMQNIVFNIENLRQIDFKGINFIFYIYELCKKNKGILFLCGITSDMKKKLKKNRVLNYIKEIDSELESFELIKV